MNQLLPSEIRQMLQDNKAEVIAATQKRASVVNWGDHGITHISELGYYTIDSGVDDYQERLLEPGESFLEIIESLVNRSETEVVSVIDIGAGTAEFTRQLGLSLQHSPLKDRVKLTALGLGDVRTNEEKKLDSKLGISFLDQDILTTHLPANSYDLIIAKDVLFHNADPIRALKKLYRSLRPDGRLYANFDLVELRTLFFESRYLRDDSKGSPRAWGSSSLMNTIIRDSKLASERFVTELIAQVNDFRSYDKAITFTKGELDTLHFPGLRYNRDVLASLKQGFLEGVYYWDGSKRSFNRLQVMRQNLEIFVAKFLGNTD